MLFSQETSKDWFLFRLLQLLLEIRSRPEIFCFMIKRPELKFVSPVSGVVKSFDRGNRRSIKDVVVSADEKSIIKVFNSGF